MHRDRWSNFVRLAALLVLVLSGVDCQPDRASEPAMSGAGATTKPTSAPSQKPPLTFEDKTAGLRFKYPAGWPAGADPTATFCVAAPADGGKGFSKLALDVPKLPWHPPGMISPRMVMNGYVDDLRKNEIHDAKVEEAADLKVAGAPARRVKCHGHDKGKDAYDVAVAVVHNDRVYIFSCDSDGDGYETARAALDAAIASVEWIK